MPNRGVLVLSIDEAEYLLDQLPAPDADEDALVTILREKLKIFLTDVRKGAEGVGIPQEGTGERV